VLLVAVLHKQDNRYKYDVCFFICHIQNILFVTKKKVKNTKAAFSYECTEINRLLIEKALLKRYFAHRIENPIF